MSGIWLVFILGLIVGIFSILKSIMVNKRDEKSTNIDADKIKEEYFRGMLAPNEILEVCVAMSYSNKYYCAATNQRLLIEDKKGLHNIPYNRIRKIVLKDFGGNKTRCVDKVIIAQIYAEEKFNLTRYSAKFDRLAESIIAHNQGLI